eukprot:2298315-Pleurochrysis_carterae.AAC.7
MHDNTGRHRRTRVDCITSRSKAHVHALAPPLPPPPARVLARQRAQPPCVFALRVRACAAYAQRAQGGSLLRLRAGGFWRVRSTQRRRGCRAKAL